MTPVRSGMKRRAKVGEKVKMPRTQTGAAYRQKIWTTKKWGNSGVQATAQAWASLIFRAYSIATHYYCRLIFKDSLCVISSALILQYLYLDDQRFQSGDFHYFFLTSIIPRSRCIIGLCDCGHTNTKLHLQMHLDEFMLMVTLLSLSAAKVIIRLIDIYIY
ncbi:hypothetical protein BJX61DRAFT_149123 [Aspergillus egyptiacus]|nr:hypothetical protein BJX61DRAFT_149123 [Aspergillus egyptiacus]